MLLAQNSHNFHSQTEQVIYLVILCYFSCCCCCCLKTWLCLDRWAAVLNTSLDSDKVYFIHILPTIINFILNFTSSRSLSLSYHLQGLLFSLQYLDICILMCFKQVADRLHHDCYLLFVWLKVNLLIYTQLKHLTRVSHWTWDWRDLLCYTCDKSVNNYLNIQPNLEINLGALN